MRIALTVSLMLLVLCGISSAQQIRTDSAPQDASKSQPPESLSGKPDRSALEAELTRKLADLDALQADIERLQKLTHKEAQVLISARLLEVNLAKARSLGLDAKTLSMLIDAPEPARPMSSGGQFAVVDQDHEVFHALAAMTDKGCIRVLGEPTVMTIVGRPAYLHAGSEAPVLIGWRNQSEPQIETRKIGTQLDCRVTKLGNGKLFLHARPHVTEINPDLSIQVKNQTVHGIRDYVVDTSAEMKPGQTVILHGLHAMRTGKGKSKNSVETQILALFRVEEVDPAQMLVPSSELEDRGRTRYRAAADER